MYVTVVFLCALLVECLSGLILPMTKSDGSADMTSLLNHVSLLEQTLTSLQATTSQVQSELHATKKDLQAAQSQLQTTVNDLQATRTQLQSSDTRQQLAAAEISSLKKEVSSLKAELRSTSDELIMVKTQVGDMAHGKIHDSVHLNQTLLDSISHDVKLNAAQVNAVATDVKQLNKQLNLMNSTVYDVKTEGNTFFHNMSSRVHAITQKQSEESIKLQTTKLLAHTASKHIDRLEDDMKSSFSNMTLFRMDIQSVLKDLHMAQSNLSLVVFDVATLKGNLSKVEKQALDNEASLVKVLHEVKARNVAFSVIYPPTPTSVNSPLTFSTILYNAGSGYSTNTGTFTAPVSGTYIFWTHLALTRANTNMSFDIVKSGGVIMANGYTETDSSIDETDASAITVTHLDKGEETWVQVAFSRDIYPSSSYFGGALLSED
ncbi:tropomyosin, muscle-like [Haliotis asinina]|uniref:tropomyosin, muscle-like n=1 Tax=Haliotis asinina TaxID=109174 RepID=UPI0035325B86